MSNPRKTAIRIVDGTNSVQTDIAASGSLAGIQQLPDGSLEFRVEAGDSTRWLPLSSPIRVAALTRDGDGRNWGRLLEVTDADGRLHRWAMPAALLANARGDEYRQTLLSLGARIAPGSAAASALHRYLSGIVDFEARKLPRAKATTRLGWHGDCFVLPDYALGSSEVVVYSTISEIRAAIRQSGTLDDWNKHVARPSEGNTRMLLALSAAFAAPLLGPLQAEGAAFIFAAAHRSAKQQR